MHRFSFYSIAFALLLFTAKESTAQGAQPGLQAAVVSKTIAVGEVGTLVLKSVNGDPESLPNSIEVNGLAITSTGSQPGDNFRINIINGVRTTESSYIYQFKGDQVGTFTIPPIQTKIRGMDVATQAIEITVYERTKETSDLDATKPMFGKFDLSRTEIWANEIVPFSVTAYVRGRGSINDIVSAELNHESFVIGKFKNVKTDAVELGNNLYDLARLPSTLFALKAGEHTLGPAEIGIRVLDRSSGFGFPGIFQRTQTHRVSTNSMKITVKALPTGAPASFTGGVGKFAITVTPSTTTPAVGDPVSLDFVVTGTGNFTTIGAPQFSAAGADEWRSYDANRTIEEPSNGETNGRAKFSQVVIPLKKVTEIPSFEFSYFDPSTGAYVTENTPPIPLTINLAGNTQLPGGASTNRNNNVGAFSSGPAASVPSAQFNDILHIRTGGTNLNLALASAGPGILFYATQFIFSLGFFTVLGLGLTRIIQKKRREKADTHVRLSFKQAVREIPRSNATRREYFRGVNRALAIWKEEHGDAPPKVLEAIDHLLEKCQSYLYSGGDKPDEAVSASEMEEFNSILVKLSHKK